MAGHMARQFSFRSPPAGFSFSTLGFSLTKSPPVSPSMSSSRTSLSSDVTSLNRLYRLLSRGGVLSIHRPVLAAMNRHGLGRATHHVFNLIPAGDILPLDLKILPRFQPRSVSHISSSMRSSRCGHNSSSFRTLRYRMWSWYDPSRRSCP